MSFNVPHYGGDCLHMCKCLYVFSDGASLAPPYACFAALPLPHERPRLPALFEAMREV